MHDLPTTKGICTQEGFIAPSDFKNGITDSPISNCTFVGYRGGCARATIKAGLEPLVVIGCARRIATALTNHTIPYLDELLSTTSVHRLAPSVLIFHDDPTDNTTLAVLRAWAQRERRVRLIVSDMGARGERIQRLTLCRNVLLAEAAACMPKPVSAAPASLSTGGVSRRERWREQARAQQGYVASIDLDCRHGHSGALLAAVQTMRTAAEGSRIGAGVGGAGGSSSNVMTPTVTPPFDRTFDVLTANNVGAYRDMWALRASVLGMDYDCFWDFKQMKHRGNCKKHRIFVHPRAAPFAVEAAFNGMAIFSAKSLTDPSISNCRFSNETIDPDSRKIHVVSEHVPYQRCLASNGIRIGVLPSLLTYCHDWATRHDAQRRYYLENNTIVALTHRRVSPNPAWMPAEWLK